MTELNISDAVKGLRKHLGWSQKKLGQAVGHKSATTICQYETGTKDKRMNRAKHTSLITFQRLCKVAKENGYLRDFMRIMSGDDQ